MTMKSNDKLEDEERAREWALEKFGEYGSTICPSVRYDTETAQGGDWR